MNIFAKLKNYIPELLLLFACAVTLLYPELSWFNTHMARDLYRASMWLHGNFSDWLGPEMGWEYKRLPGPFLYWLLAILSLAGSIHFIIAAKIILTFGAVLLLVRQLKQNFDQKLILFFLSLFLLMPVFFFTSRDLWNPSWIVLFNCLQFLFFLKLTASNRRRWVYAAGITALAGMQIHFSTLIPYGAAVITIFLGAAPKDLKRHQWVSLGALFLWLTVWYFSGAVTEFNSQLKSFYGSSSFWYERLQDLSSHISLSLMELKDYDLFTLHFRILKELNPAFETLEDIVWLQNWFYLILFALAVFRLSRVFAKTKDSLSLFLLLIFAFFTVSILLLKNKEHVPYRYGLGFYPFQFFMIAYGLWGIRKNVYDFLVFIATLTFVFYSFFNGEILDVQAISGRAHHTNNDNLELTLENKEFLYGILKTEVPPGHDPFEKLHGRAASKFRLKEMNWDETQPYFSLYRFVSGNEVELLRRAPTPGPHWLLQLSSLDELKAGNHSLSLTDLPKSRLPKDVKIHYYGQDGDLLEEQTLLDGEMILPMAFVKDAFKVAKIRIQFNLESSGFLNVLMDDNNDYRFAYRDQFRQLSVKINGVLQTPVSAISGFFLVQNQYIYPLPAEKTSFVEIEAFTNLRNRNFARVDIFSTESQLGPEEIFPKQK